ncbi:MAG: hypothetical protein CSYNP_03130 [Syntrophus sp. SKADARSKE-3]|nr:hypothetical protein [Syntrophus sp. SKADARSKE-3]
MANYLKTKSVNPPQPNLSQPVTANSTPATKIQPQKEDTSLFKFLGKQLMKPLGVGAEALETVSNTAGSLILPFTGKYTVKEGFKKAGQELKQGAKDIKDVITGDKETSISEKVNQNYDTLNKISKENTFDKVAKNVIGIGGDFFIDPINFIKPVKIAQKVGEVTRLNKILAPAAKAVEESGTFKKVKSVFSNTTGNKEFDDTVSKFRNLYQYEEGKLIDQAVNLQKDIKKLGKGAEEIITNGLENPASLAGKDKKIVDIVVNLKTTYKDFLDKTKEVGLSVGEIADYAPHIRTKESLTSKMQKVFGTGAREWTKAGVEKGRKLRGTIQELADQGIDIFEKNPAVQLAKKGQTYVKAITSKQFADEIAKHAVEGGVEVSNTLLKGLKFAPEHAKVIDNFYQGIKPDELKVIVKGFDKVQNWWKAQALVAPSYHVRNIAGNLWNNFLAGVTPEAYIKAGVLQKNPETNLKLLENAKKLGVIDEGWYAKDIGEEVLNKIDKTKNFLKGINPLSQENYLFRGNKKVGSVIENNARLAHFISQVEKGKTFEEAAKSVKKFLFDYGDLTNIERNVFKRAMPFYTWTRKNLPLQIGEFIKQPAKYILPHKIVEKIESGVEQPNEKYMSDYIRSNIPVRIRKNKEGNTEYFLLGQWLPYGSAIDVLSQPLDTFKGMVTPLIKTPYEQASNKSTFFKNTLGEASPIENRYAQQGEFLGMSLRKKNINLLRNIRILSDMNKWFDKQDPTETKDALTVKVLNTLFGKSATYDESKSRKYYQLDTEDRLQEYEKAIKDAKKRGYYDKAKELNEEMKQFKKERGH